MTEDDKGTIVKSPPPHIEEVDNKIKAENEPLNNVQNQPEVEEEDPPKIDIKVETKGSRCSGLLTKLEPPTSNPSTIVTTVDCKSSTSSSSSSKSSSTVDKKIYTFEKFSYMENVKPTTEIRPPSIRFLIEKVKTDDTPKLPVTPSRPLSETPNWAKVMISKKKVTKMTPRLLTTTKSASLNKRRTIFKTNLIQRSRNFVYTFRDKFQRLRNGKQRKDKILKLRKRPSPPSAIESVQSDLKLTQSPSPSPSPPPLPSSSSPPPRAAINNTKVEIGELPLLPPVIKSDENILLLTSEPILEKIPADMPVPFEKIVSVSSGNDMPPNEPSMSILYTRVSTDSAIGGSIFNSPSSLVSSDTNAIGSMIVTTGSTIPSNFITNPLDIQYGEIITVYYADDLHLVVVVQENLISFWKYRPLVLVFGVSQLWKNCGCIKRDNNGNFIKFMNSLLRDFLFGFCL